MDMANATASGPSYGLIDVIFGSTPKEEAPADGEGFGNLLKLIKSLDKKVDEEATDKSRTDKETASGRMENELLYSIVPGMMPVATNVNQSVPAGMEGMSASSDNLSPISLGSKASAAQWLSAEQAALAEKAQQGQVPVDALTAAVDPETKALFSGMLIGHALAKAQRHPNTASKAEGLIDAKGKIVGDLPWVSEEQQPIKSTQDFLNMRAIAKPDASNQAAPVIAGNQQKAEIAQDSIALLAAKQVAAKAGQIEASGETKGRSGGESTPDENSSQNGSSHQLPTAHGVNFASHQVDQDLKFGATLAAGIGSRDIFMDGSSKENIRAGLIPEMAQTISTQHTKGGGEMRLILHPDDLGEVRVKVGTKNGRIEVSATAESKEVADIIRAGSKDLEKALSDQSLTLAKFEVKVHDGSHAATTVSELRDSAAGSNSQTFSDSGANSSFFENRGGSGFNSSDRGAQREHREAVERSELSSRNGSMSSQSTRTKSYNQSGRLDVVA